MRIQKIIKGMAAAPLVAAAIAIPADYTAQAQTPQIVVAPQHSVPSPDRTRLSRQELDELSYQEEILTKIARTYVGDNKCSVLSHGEKRTFEWSAHTSLQLIEVKLGTLAKTEAVQKANDWIAATTCETAAPEIRVGYETARQMTIGIHGTAYPEGLQYKDLLLGHMVYEKCPQPNMPSETQAIHSAERKTLLKELADRLPAAEVQRLDEQTAAEYATISSDPCSLTAQMRALRGFSVQYQMKYGRQR